MTGRELKRFASDLYSIYTFKDYEPEDFVRVLLRSGVIGMPYSQESPKGKSDLYHKARFEYVMADTLPYRDDLRYCVHPVMGDLFDMKHPQDGKAIYPYSELEGLVGTGFKHIKACPCS